MIDISSIDDKTLASMPEGELIDLLGLAPYARANSLRSLDEITKHMHFMNVAPKEVNGDIIKLARYLDPDPNYPFDSSRSLYMVAKHHRLIADAFNEILEGKNLRLCLSIPPQFGKSRLAKLLLAEYAARYPWKHVISGCYNQTLADEYGEDLRAILSSEGYKRVYPHISFRKGSKAKEHMVLSRGGKYSFIGRDGSGTGRPADGILIDDLIKNKKEAESKIIRDDCWNFFTTVANSRSHVLTWQVIIMTRWSDDDIIARLTDPKNPYYNEDVAKYWTVINVPAIIDTDEIAAAMGMKKGEALWPERFPLEHLQIARRMNETDFSALYMGRPTPPEGSFYKQADLYTYDRPQDFPQKCVAYMTGDLAVKPEVDADRSCVGIWGLSTDNILYLHPDLYWARKSSDQSVSTIINKGKQYRVMEAWFERGQMEHAIGPFLKAEMEREKAYFTLSTQPNTGSKAAKSLSIRGLMRAGRVRFPSFAPWWSNAKEEMLKFTGTGNDKADDFCDMAALIGQALGSQILPSEAKVTNVIDLPTVVNMRYITADHRKKKDYERKRSALRGM